MRRQPLLAGAMMVLLAACGDDDSSGLSGAGGDGGTGGVGGTAETDINVAGLSAPVNAYFDANGMLHAECQTDADCAATLGYFHARDRFIQMDVRRRFTRGTLTEIVSAAVRPLVIDFSLTNRAVFSTRQGRPLEEQVLEAADAPTRALLDAYTEGVNAWIADAAEGRNGARLPDEYSSFIFDLGEPPTLAPWTPEDSVASVLALIEALTNRSEEEIALGTIAAQTDEATFLDLYGLTPGTQSRILDDYVGPPLFPRTELPPTASQLAKSSAQFPHAARQIAKSDAQSPSTLSRSRLSTSRAAQSRFLPVLADAWTKLTAFRPDRGRFRQNSIGSNNWAVRPQRSQTGNALLSNDPHLPMSNPALWYLAHLDAKTQGQGDFHVAGVTFAGIPFVVLGQSEQLAWGATTANMDLVDAYQETLTADGTGVRFNSEDVPFLERELDLRFSDGTIQTETLRWVPHHGPVISIDEENGTAVSIRWRGQDASTDVNVVTGLYTASTIDEARTAIEDSISIGQNWVVADTAGSIGWFPYNQVPVRTWGATFRPWTPIPGDGSAEWGPMVANADLPQAVDPEEGYIATANNDMTGALADGDPANEPYTVLQSFVAPGYRHARIVERLEASMTHTVADMEAIQADTRSLVAVQVLPSLLAVAEGLSLSEDGQRVINALSDWTFFCPTGLDGTDPMMSPDTSDAAVLAAASGCAAFHVLLRELEIALIGDEVNALGMFDDGRPDFRPDLRPAIEATLFSLAAPERLAGGDVYWDDVSTPDVVETKPQIVALAVEAAAQFLVGALGNDEQRWPWGRLHAMNMRSDLDTASGGLILDFNHPLVANDGGLFTVDVADPVAGLDTDDNPLDDFIHEQGPSMRLNCELTPSRPDCTIQLPGGQVGFADSPHYNDLLDEFLRNESVPLPFDVRAVAENAETSFTLVAP